MKLAEALLEKIQLDERVKLLSDRITRDLEHGRPTSHLQEELTRTSNQARDITISIEWTEQTSSMSGLPLGAYRTRISYLLSLAEVFETINPEKADAYWNSAYHDKRLVEAATWLIDLKIPGSAQKEES